MSHGFELAEQAIEVAEPPPLPGAVGVLERVMRVLNRVLLTLGGIALLAAALTLTDSVVSRYALKIPTDWQDETAIFLLVGATFLCSAAVQARRGHVGIEAVASLLSPRANRIRMIVCDVLSLLFCAFFAWKSWTLFLEAWVDDKTSTSSWGPPLWIPYGLMPAGMTLLCVQLLLQVLDGMIRPTEPNR